MAAITITNDLSALETHFCQMHHIFYIAEPNQSLSELTSFDAELPVLEDGVGFDTGAANVSRVKITGRHIRDNLQSQG